MKMPQLNEVWTHYKGGKYRICAFAWNAVGEKLVLMVMYQSERSAGSDGPIFCRTISNFLEPVNDCPRFERGA
jgi:hypothetical protein